jgi:hypothetical protein
MISIRRTATLLACAAALVACTKSDTTPSTSTASSPDSAAASTSSAAPPSAGTRFIDEATLHDFRLSDAKISRSIRATDNLRALMKAHPELQSKMEAMGRASNDAKTLNEFVDRIDGVPPVHQAIEGAGISTRDWVLTLMTGMSAEMNYQIQKSGVTQKLASTVSPENLSYVAGHRAQMQALTASAEKLGSGASSENP